MWDWTIKGMYETICSEGDSSKLSDLADQISYAQGYGYSVVEQVIRRFWGLIILTALSVISLPLLWKNFSHRHHDECIFAFYGPLGMLVLVIPVLYIFNLAFGPLRLVVYVSMLGTIFAAYFLSYLLTDEKKDSISRRLDLKILFVILVISGLFLGGLLNLYPSPYNLTQSYQTTQAEVAGMTYFYEHRDVNMPLSGINIAPGRFADASLTPEERIVQNLPQYLEDQTAPWHFGYDKYPSISSVYDEATDLVLKQQDKITFLDYFPDMAQFRYTNQDFERLNEDSGLDFLYSNGGFDLWKINPVT